MTRCALRVTSCRLMSRTLESPEASDPSPCSYPSPSPRVFGILDAILEIHRRKGMLFSVASLRRAWSRKWCFRGGSDCCPMLSEVVFVVVELPRGSLHVRELTSNPPRGPRSTHAWVCVSNGRKAL